MATSLPTRHPGNLAVRDFRGASRNVRHGETVNPPAIERTGPETPHLQRGALDLYPNRRHHSKPGPRHDPTLPMAGVPSNIKSSDYLHTSASGCRDCHGNPPAHRPAAP